MRHQQKTAGDYVKMHGEFRCAKHLEEDPGHEFEAQKERADNPRENTVVVELTLVRTDKQNQEKGLRQPQSGPTNFGVSFTFSF